MMSAEFVAKHKFVIVNTYFINSKFEIKILTNSIYDESYEK